MHIRAIKREENGALTIQYAQLTTETVLVPLDEAGNELRGQALYDWLDTHAWDNYIPRGTTFEADPEAAVQLGIDGVYYTTRELARLQNSPANYIPPEVSPVTDAHLKSLIYEVLAEIEASKV